MKSLTLISFAFISFSFVLLLFVNLRKSKQEFEVIGYSQDESSITIEFSSYSNKLSIVKTKSIPLKLDLEALKKKSYKVKLSTSLLDYYLFKKSNIVIPLVDEPFDTEYSIILFNQDDYVEFVRQSKKFLKDKFLFDRVGGYTLLGRRSIQIIGKNPYVAQPVTLYGNPKIDFVDLESLKDQKNISDYEEINYASLLTKKLYELPIFIGPNSKNYYDFLNQSFEDKLNEIQLGHFSVQCGAFRDLFLHAAESIPLLKVRSIDAFNYEPFLNDLIPYSHAAVEIWVESLGQWILFDPWNAFYITENGIPVSSKRLTEIEKSNNLKIIPILLSISRNVLGKNGVSEINFNTSDFSLFDYFCLELQCIPPYIEYFNEVKIIKHTVID